LGQKWSGQVTKDNFPLQLTWREHNPSTTCLAFRAIRLDQPAERFVTVERNRRCRRPDADGNAVEKQLLLHSVAVIEGAAEMSMP
jgi:hypothetical protein